MVKNTMLHKMQWQNIMKGDKDLNTVKKELRDLNLLDRFLFAEVIEDQKIMEIILDIILGKTVTLKHLPQSEKEQRSFLWSKQVKLDVWAQDMDDNIYDTEVQKRDTKDLPKRSRLYNSMIDTKLLLPGTASYNELNDVYVIIISPFDLFGKGRYKYTFTMDCVEVPGIRLNDGATRIFLNTKGNDPTGVSGELMELLRYFENSTAKTAEDSGSEKILKLHEKVTQVRMSEEIGVKYMNAWEEKLLDRQDGYEEGEKHGIELGEKRGINAVALKMKQSGMPLKEIADLTGLSISDIEKL